MESKNYDPIVEKILSDLRERFSDNIISVYGIGSYFDDELPSDWIKNDLDIVVIVKSFTNTPKYDWTNVRYEKKEIDDCGVWIGFHTLEGFNDKARFKNKSFSNYEWSLLDLKHPENSKLLYGQDIREQLPDTTKIKFNFDDILARSLYHLDKSLGEAISKNLEESMREFTKSVFKFGFYLCIYFDQDFFYTSIRRIAVKIEKLKDDKLINRNFLEMVKKSIIFRRTNHFNENFRNLRNSFIILAFFLLVKGKLHRKFNYGELIKYLKESFGGFRYLIQMAENIEKKL